MSYYEIFAVIFSLLCVILTIRRSVWCWGVGIVGVVFYAYFFYCEQLYADMVLQVVYFLQGVYGWLMWLNNGAEPDDSNKITVDKLSKRDVLKHLLVAFGLWWLVMYILTYVISDSSLPAVDALLSVASLTANYYLAKRIIESWAIWIVVDFGYVLLFLYKELYLSAGLYFIFFFMAIYGLLEWKKTLNTKTVSS
jgi:nicotinamide mononucleotide transporter